MMTLEETDTNELLDSIIKEYLKPVVKKVDTEAFYAEDYLVELGYRGFFNSKGCSEQEVLEREAMLVEKTSELCMTTGFNLWCHLAALTYIRNCNNRYLKIELLPCLERGECLGGTGLSNPMKYYSGLEKLHLKAEKSEGGYRISGHLASVSNLKENHWFGVIASINEDEEVMAFVPCNAEGLKLKEKADYIGVNGSATYACKFSDVFIPDEWIIATEAGSFVDQIRPAFLLYQVPLGLGVTSAVIKAMVKAPKKMGNANEYLSVQPDELEEKYNDLSNRLSELIHSDNLLRDVRKLMQLRLEVDEMTIKAAHGNMLHHGGAGYLKNSHPSRRLRETYFLLNLTPTVKHLEKELSSLSFK